MFILGFIRRQCWNFNNIQCLRTLYCLLVRSNIEYGSILQNPSQFGHINNLNKIHYLFLKYLSNQLRTQWTDDPVLKLSLHTLCSRRKYFFLKEHQSIID